MKPCRQICWVFSCLNTQNKDQKLDNNNNNNNSSSSKIYNQNMDHLQSTMDKKMPNYFFSVSLFINDLKLIFIDIWLNAWFC